MNMTRNNGSEKKKLDIFLTSYISFPFSHKRLPLKNEHTATTYNLFIKNTTSLVKRTSAVFSYTFHARFLMFSEIKGRDQ